MNKDNPSNVNPFQMLGNGIGLLSIPLEEQVWLKGHIIDQYHPGEWRRDDFGHLICRDAYGDQSSPYGWQIDHITPTAIGGLNTIDNLRPLHSRRNASLGGLLGALLR